MGIKAILITFYVILGILGDTIGKKRQIYFNQ